MSQERSLHSVQTFEGTQIRELPVDYDEMARNLARSRTVIDARTEAYVASLNDGSLEARRREISMALGRFAGVEWDEATGQVVSVRRLSHEQIPHPTATEVSTALPHSYNNVA